MDNYLFVITRLIRNHFFLFRNKYSIKDLSQSAHDVVTTLHERCSNVKMFKRRRDNVVLTLCVGWVRVIWVNLQRKNKTRHDKSSKILQRTRVLF